MLGYYSNCPQGSLEDDPKLLTDRTRRRGRQWTRRNVPARGFVLRFGFVWARTCFAAGNEPRGASSRAGAADLLKRTAIGNVVESWPRR